eukprot:scaffold108160_cov14-Tisochrysis_lutea.AAC.1
MGAAALAGAEGERWASKGMGDFCVGLSKSGAAWAAGWWLDPPRLRVWWWWGPSAAERGRPPAVGELWCRGSSCCAAPACMPGMGLDGTAQPWSGTGGGGT